MMLEIGEYICPMCHLLGSHMPVEDDNGEQTGEYSCEACGWIWTPILGVCCGACGEPEALADAGDIPVACTACGWPGRSAPQPRTGTTTLTPSPPTRGRSGPTDKWRNKSVSAQSILAYAVKLLQAQHANERQRAYERVVDIRNKANGKPDEAEDRYVLGFWEGQHAAYSQISDQLRALIDHMEEKER